MGVLPVDIWLVGLKFVIDSLLSLSLSTGSNNGIWVLELWWRLLVCLFTHPLNMCWALTRCPMLVWLLGVEWWTRQTRALPSEAYTLIKEWQTVLNWANWTRYFLFPNNFTEVYFTHHKIHPLQVCNSMTFSRFPEWYNNHHKSVLEQFHPHSKIPHAHLQLIPVSAPASIYFPSV